MKFNKKVEFGCISALLVMTVVVQFVSNRACIITGSLLITSANIITAYATDIRLLFVSVGVMEGKITLPMRRNMCFKVYVYV